MTSVNADTTFKVWKEETQGRIKLWSLKQKACTYRKRRFKKRHKLENFGIFEGKKGGREGGKESENINIS